jgi:hypothetical protein
MSAISTVLPIRYETFRKQPDSPCKLGITGSVHNRYIEDHNHSVVHWPKEALLFGQMFVDGFKESRSLLLTTKLNCRLVGYSHGEVRLGAEITVTGSGRRMLESNHLPVLVAMHPGKMLICCKNILSLVHNPTNQLPMLSLRQLA